MIQFKLLQHCKECSNHKGIVDKMVRCERGGLIGITPIIPSNYFSGIINNGLDCVRCVGENDHANR